LSSITRSDRYPFSERIRNPEGDPRQALARAGAPALAGAKGVCAAASKRSDKAPARLKPYDGPPMTLGSAAAAGVRLIVWCKECRHQVEPDPAEMATRYGAETPVLDWRQRLVCSQCGGRQVDMVLTGTKR
jgi:hypothetical protein